MRSNRPPKRRRKPASEAPAPPDPSRTWSIRLWIAILVFAMAALAGALTLFFLKNQLSLALLRWILYATFAAFLGCELSLAGIIMLWWYRRKR